ncbi:hypothetical protein GCM10007209_10540 [Haloferax sulfurifontis]|uniref:Uncharacterized protein n=1 Tax=Haloferax sulfurifontis TaxID=255616 RepID=A0A830E4W7_9EURY|nr:hypothetical protein GCM10007209_10540 [Haloferax sulfurifontis]
MRVARDERYVVDRREEAADERAQTARAEDEDTHGYPFSADDKNGEFRGVRDELSEKTNESYFPDWLQFRAIFASRTPAC